MVKVIQQQRSPSFAEKFSNAIGSGLETGTQLYESYQKNKEQKKIELAKKSAKIRPGIKSFLSLYDKNKAFDSEMIGNLENLSHKYVEQGFEPDEAISAAYNDILGSSETQNAGAQKSEMPGHFSGDKDLAQRLGIISKEGALSDIATGLKKGGRIAANILDFPFAIAKKGNYMGRGNFKSPTDYYDELTGGKGTPTNAVERVAQGIPFGLPGVAGAFTEEALHSAGLPESVQQTGGILVFLGSHRIKVPELKNVIGDAKKVAEKTGQTTEQVLANAQKESGVSLEKIASGDKESISALKNKISKAPEISKKVEQTPKAFFNKKAAEKQRAVFGAKLPEGPLQEYYGIKAREAETQASKRPETLQREKEIRDRLAPEETKVYKELQNQKEQLNRIEQERRMATGEAKQRLDMHHDFQLKKFNETREALKDIQYEMKYGRSRPSEAEIDAQIQKSVKEFEEGITNPTEKTEKAIKRQLDLDKQYLERASKILSRGELPGEIRPDTFIKMKQKYLQGYKAAIERAKAQFQALKGETDAMSKAKIQANQELVKRLSDRVKRLEADVVNQTDNIRSMRALEKPSGAFYKQQLKALKKDAALFEHDLFKQHRIKNPEEIKTSKVFKDASADIKAGKDLAENPSRENVEKIVTETGKKESEILGALKELKKGVEDIKTPVKTGTLNPNQERKLTGRLKFAVKYMGGGAALGALIGTLEEVFGVKLNTTFMKQIARILGYGTVGATTFGKSIVRDIFDDVQASELKKLRGNPSAWNKYLKNMELKHGKAKVRRVLKSVNQKESS